MKKIILSIFYLMLFVLTGHAQKFLDIYQNNKIVSSVKAADVDSMVISEDGESRMLDFYHDGVSFHHNLTDIVDSIKVYNTEGDPLVYLGIVGFNQELYDKEFGVLSKNTADGFKSFVNNLTRKDGTLLYYGVEHALDMLSEKSFYSQVNSVNLITFTDGLDQGSLMMNSNYNTDDQYLNAVSNRIRNTRVKGIPLTAYSLGLRGDDVSNYSQFQNNLAKLASSSDKAFEVSSMTEVNNRLYDISDQIISISNKQTISMKIPGQSNGTVIRFTFDNSSATSSSIYIEGTFNLSDRSLRNVTYHGLSAESGSTVYGKQDGIFVTFTFNGLQRSDGKGFVPTNNIREYYKLPTATSWQENSEFTPDNNTITSISHSGAIIMLVLDCSNSLGSQFSDMKSYAKTFIDNVANNAAEGLDRPFGNRPKGSGETFVVNGVEFNMVKVAGGTFQMGATSEQGSDYFDNELPVHQVTLSDYYIGEIEVTQELWQAVMGSNPSNFRTSNKLPVEIVSWNDCQTFITKLNQLTGMQFRLPTEAEWEFAARGGNKSKGYKYSGSNDIDEVAWYYYNSGGETHEVGTKLPNELGIFDMIGNVWEWCQDRYGSYSSSAQTNPTGPSTGSNRVIRGGSWDSEPRYCRVSRRYGCTPDRSDRYLGLRLAL